VSIQDRCTLCAKRTIGSELILDTPAIVLLGDGAQGYARFSPFGDSLDIRWMHGLRRTYHRLRNNFGRTG
jgi:hypothetical protein